MPLSYTLKDFQTALVNRASNAFGRATNDAIVMAITMLGEARGEGLDGMIAVGQTLLNRVADRPGPTITERALQRAQYSCWWPAGGQEDNAYVLDLAERAMAETLLPADYTEALYLAGGVIGHRVRNYAAGATHYCTNALLAHAATTPAWAVGQTPVTILHRHAFFAHIPWS